MVCEINVIFANISRRLSVLLSKFISRELVAAIQFLVGISKNKVAVFFKLFYSIVLYNFKTHV